MDVDETTETPGSGQYVTTVHDARAFIPNPLPDTIHFTSALVTVIVKAASALGGLAGVGTWSGSSSIQGVLVGPLLRREATTSSRIEGTRTDLGQLLMFEASDEYRDPEGDAKEVANYLEALMYGLNRHPDRPISSQFIRELHSILLQDARGTKLSPGDYRITQNWIGRSHRIESARYVPPPPTHVIDLMDDLLGFIEHPPSDVPAVVRIAMVHYQFEAIHPFLDGNGRVARLLVVLLLIEWDVLNGPWISISEVLEQRRSEYVDGLRGVSGEGDWEGWIEFFVQALADQATRDRSRIESLQHIREQWRHHYVEGRSTTAVQLVDFVVERPVFNINQIVQRLAVAVPTAQRAVNLLARDGLIREMTGQKRNRIYVADEVMEIVMPSP